MAKPQKPTGYLALPPSGSGPGVLVLHAWWGLNEVIKDVCNRLAGVGFVAYAPDLYHGRLASTIAEAEALGSELDSNSEAARADVAAALNHLWEQAQPGDRGLGVVAFSLGAYYALQLSDDEPERVRAVVLFYGGGDGDLDQAKATYLGHFAGDDPYEPAEAVDMLENALVSSGRAVTFHRYEGVGHWFFEPDRPDAYDEAAAKVAWERTVTFLKENL
jgi:carboxymethylenebutenolidase